MTAYSDTMYYYAGMLPSETDYKASRLAYHYSDIMTFLGGSKATISGPANYHDTLLHLAAGRFGPLASAVMGDHYTFQAGGRLTETDSQSLHDTPIAYLGGKATEIDRQVLHDTLLHLAGGEETMTVYHPPYADTFAFLAAGQQIMSTTAAQHDTLTHKAAGEQTMIDSQSLHDTTAHLASAKATETDRQILRDTMTTQAGGLPSETDSRAYRDTLAFLVAGQAQVSAARASQSDTASFQAAGRLTQIETLITDSSGFIAALRAKMVATFPELTRVVESLNEATTLAEKGILPFGVMIVGEDSAASSDYPVQTEAQVVPVDFVYVGEIIRTGNTDNGQYLRSRLNLLQQAFLSDRRLSNLVNSTEQVHTPMDRANMYQSHFAGLQAAQIAVMIVTFEFTRIQSTLQWAK